MKYTVGIKVYGNRVGGIRLNRVSAQECKNREIGDMQERDAEFNDNKNADCDGYCVYYRAGIVRSQVWFFVAILRSFDHVAFDRTYDVANSVFEFFVPAKMESYFVEIVRSLEKEGVVQFLHKMPNRLYGENEQV